MAYVKPTQKQIEFAISQGWSRDEAERGYAIFNYDGLGLYEIEAIGDVYVRFKGNGVYQLDTNGGYDDDACAVEAERSGYCKIIPVNELPDNFERKYFGWIDTPENRKAIKNYCDKKGD